MLVWNGRLTQFLLCNEYFHYLALRHSNHSLDIELMGGRTPTARQYANKLTIFEDKGTFIATLAVQFRIKSIRIFRQSIFHYELPKERRDWVGARYYQDIVGKGTLLWWQWCVVPIHI